MQPTLDMAAHGGTQSGNGGAVPTQPPRAMSKEGWTAWLKQADEYNQAQPRRETPRFEVTYIGSDGQVIASAA